MRNGDYSSEATDVGVVNLTDRRVIADQKKQIADLEAKLAEAQSVAKPGLEKKLRTECYHQGSFVVADHELDVTCKVCGAKMDPYEVLRKIAHREVNFCYQSNALRKEAEQLRKEVESLKGKRSRLKTQVQKATPDMSLDELAKHVAEMSADVVELKLCAGEWGVWFQNALKRKVLAGGVARTLRGAVAAALENRAAVAKIGIPDLGA